MPLLPRRTRVDQDFLDAAADMDAARVNDYGLYGDYYDGEHKTRLTDRARKFLQASGVPFCENFCDVVVDALAERLILLSFGHSALEDHERAGEDPLVQTMSSWWERNRMDGKQGIVHTNTLVKGDGGIIVDFDNERRIPRFTWLRPEIFKPVYSAERPDEMEYCSKVWNDRVDGRQVVRLNIYWPDHVDRYFKLSSDDASHGKGGWAPFRRAGDEDASLPWVTRIGEPLGIPVFHFRNKPLGRALGRSRVKMVMPFQDEINKQVLDLNAILDNQGWPQQWVTGVASDNVSYKRVIGDIWQATNQEAEFGQLDAADVDPVVNAIGETLSRMARKSRVPLHLLTGGDAPSGEALKSAEAGLVATAHDCQTNFGNTWEDAMHCALRLAAEFGDLEQLPADLTVKSNWRDAESRNDKEDWETAALKHELGVSKRTLLTEKGYDPDQEAERRQAEASEAQQALATAMDRGTLPFADPNAEPDA